MAKTLAILHTGAFLAPVFADLCKELLPDVNVFHMCDESLIKNTIAANRLTPATARRLAQHLQSAEEAGADVVLVTCSSVGPAVEAARPFLNIPVVRVDQPMADEAISIGRRIGVVATLQTTLEPTVNLIKERAAMKGQAVEVTPQLCEQAFDALTSGDAATHDRIVTAALLDMMNRVDVVVLAQASMGRVADSIPAVDKHVPILASPRLGVEAIRQIMADLR